MPKDQSYIKDLAVELITANQPRNRLFEQADAHYQVQWSLPAPMKRMGWVREIKTTDPHDSVEAGKRVLSALQPDIRVSPEIDDEANKVVANKWEKQLKWYFLNASTRRSATVLSDIVMSALLYDMICVQVVYLPYQAKEEKTIKEGSADYSDQMRHGPFVLNVHNPQDVFPMESSRGVSGVLLRRQLRAHEVEDEWGMLAHELLAKMQSGEDASASMDYVTIYDWWDKEVRYVWGVPGTDTIVRDPGAHGGIDILPPFQHKLNWTPWVVRKGGTSLFSQSDHSLHPMLYSVIQAGQWDTQNIAETLAVSEIISYSAAPRGVVSGPTPNGVVRKYGEPGNLAWEMPGHSYRPESPPSMDPALFTVVDRQNQRIQQSTVAKILSNADVAPNTAFSTLNLATQTALGSLKPPKHLSEVACSDIITTMLMWIKLMGEKAVGRTYGQDGRVAGQSVIDPNEINPEAIYVDVELKPDVPTDRGQRINNGKILQTMGVSVRRSLEESGIPDPEDAIAEGYYDRILETHINLQLQEMAAESQLRIEMARTQAMQAMQAQMMQAQQAQMQQPQGPPGVAPVGPDRGGDFGQFGDGGGFAPGLGGQPSATVNPNGTREQISGRDRNGNEV